MPTKKKAAPKGAAAERKKATSGDVANNALVAALHRSGCSARTIEALTKTCEKFEVPTSIATLAERIALMTAVKKAEVRLSASLGAITDFDHLDLYTWMGGRVNESPEFARFLPLLRHGCDKVLEGLETQRAGKKREGRRKTSGPAHSMVLLIARHVAADGIKPSRAERSRFMAICRACFDECNLRNPDSAARWLISPEGRKLAIQR